MMVSDWIEFVRRLMHIGAIPFVLLVVICTGIGWAAHRIAQGLNSTIVTSIMFIIALGISIEMWSGDIKYEWIFAATATASIGAVLYKRLH